MEERPNAISLAEFLRLAIEEENWGPLLGRIREMCERKARLRGLDPDDIAQEVFLKMWNGGHFKKLYDQDANTPRIRRYVLLTIHSVCRDMEKGKKKELPFEEKHDFKVEDDIIEVMENEEEKKLVREVIRNMPSLHRRIIEKLIDGKNKKEVAKEEGISPALITYVIKKVSEKMRTCIRKRDK